MAWRRALIALLTGTWLARGVSAQPPAPAGHTSQDAPLQHASTPDGSYAIEYRWDAPQPHEGQFQVLHISVTRVPEGCRRSGVIVSVDAAMPEHGHGLDYRPVVTATPAHRDFLAKGIMFHMAGAWEVYLDLACGNTTTRLTVPVSVS